MSTEKYKRPSWDEYFMRLVKEVGSRATCDRGRSGCVVTRDRRILSTGYVGAPAGCKDCDEVGHEMHSVTHPNGKQSQHCIRTSHAEANAIALAARNGVMLDGATLYCNMTPCYACAKVIINAGIVRVIVRTDYHAGERSKEIFKEAGIDFEIVEGGMETYENQ